MKNRKILVSSMIMIISCCLLFAGTTFAWFSDSVTSNNNIITAGNLDVELEYSTDGKTWSTVESDTSIFKEETLWEPGHTEAVLLKISNEGSLSLKYDLNLAVTNEVSSINVYGDEFKLSDYLIVGAKVSDQLDTTALNNRIDAVKVAEDNEIGFSEVSVNMLLASEAHYVQLVICMPDTVGNEANAIKGAATPSIKFGINLFATQLNHESDSFGPDYDKGVAWYGEVDTDWYDPTLTEYTLVSGSELAGLAALVNGTSEVATYAATTKESFAGKTIKLAGNIDLNGKAWTPIGLTGDVDGFKGTFDGQGYTISNLNIDLTANPKYQSAGLFGSARDAVIKNLTVNNATVKNLTTGSQTSCGTAVVLGSSQFGSIIENVKVVNAEVSGNRYVSAIAGYFKGSINGCTVDGAELVATPDNFSGSYDNGDKVGAIIGTSNGAVTLTGNTVSNSSIKGYRDLGAIAGAANCGEVSGNTVTSVSINADQVTINYGEKAVNAQAVVGRVLGGVVGENTTSEVSVEALYLLDGFQVSSDDTGVVSLYVIPAEFDETVVTLPEGIEEIGGYAFAYNSNIEKIVLPSTVKTLNDRAFRDTSAKEVVLNEGLENISYQAFRNASNVEKVVIPSTVKTISKEAFQNSGIKSLIIPASVQTIESGALRDMKLVETIVFEGDVTLPVYALRACTNLKTVIFKGEVTIDGRGMVITNKENGDGSVVTVYVPTEASKQALLAGDTAATDYTGYEIVVGGYAVPGTTEELYDAIKAGQDKLFLAEGTYIIPDSAQGKTLHIVGLGDNTVVAVQDDGSYEGCDYSLDGATVIFENITINTDSSIYTGYARLKNATYINCTINGTYTLYGDSTFINCTFNVSGDRYNIWTWGAKNATFENCTFNTSGKALLLYGNTNTVLTVNNCVFNDANDYSNVNNKAAIEVGSDWSNDTKTIIATNCTVNGFDVTNKGLNTGTTLWGNKNSLDASRLSVTIDGVKVY